MENRKIKRVLVLTNARAGLGWSLDDLRDALNAKWKTPETSLRYQCSRNVEDGINKARQAVAAGIDLVLVIGGDGTLSTIARGLIGSPTAIGILPVGSGNGFARHFNIPLDPQRAVDSLDEWQVRPIDVGVVNERPFLVTCSMAWDAAIVRSFERSPFRGVLPYVLAGVYEFFDYRPQPMKLNLDETEVLHLENALMLTVANLTQYGGGAQIAPSAQPDDGKLELVTARRQDIFKLLANIRRVFDGTADRIPEISTRQFQTLSIQRSHPSEIQVDGELVSAGERIVVRVLPGALNVFVPP